MTSFTDGVTTDSVVAMRWSAAMQHEIPLWVNCCPCDYVGRTSGVPQIAARLDAPPNSAALGQRETFQTLPHTRRLVFNLQS
jgi:hypothetical protein